MVAKRCNRSVLAMRCGTYWWTSRRGYQKRTPTSVGALARSHSSCTARQAFSIGTTRWSWKWPATTCAADAFGGELPPHGCSGAGSVKARVNRHSDHGRDVLIRQATSISWS